MRNTNVLQNIQHSCWDPIPSERKGHLCIPTQIYHVVLFSPTFLKLNSCSDTNSCPGAAGRTGCADIPGYLQSTMQRSLETRGMLGSWKVSGVAGERGEKDDHETKEREGVSKLSWLVQGILRGFLFLIYGNVIKNSLKTWTRTELSKLHSLVSSDQRVGNVSRCFLCLSWWVSWPWTWLFHFHWSSAMLEGFMSSEFPQANVGSKACNRKHLLFKPPFSFSVPQLIPLAM